MSMKTITPVESLQGKVDVSSDKSISHRALMLASIADGTSEITGLSDSKDVYSTIECLSNLGIEIETEGSKCTVHGQGKLGYQQPPDVLNAGNSGTTMRLLSGILVAQPFTSIITGDESLQKRPMRRIIDPLEQMGAQIKSNNYRPPLEIRGGKLVAIDYATRVASAQVKSCILFAGLYARGTTRVTEPYASRDHTERMLLEFGVKTQFSMGGAGVQGAAVLNATHIDVPKDLSSAAFFLIAASLVKNSKIYIDNVGINPTRIGILDTLTAMGAKIDKTNTILKNGEPRANLTAVSSNLKAVTLSGSIIPRIIDEIPVLAVAATQAEGTTHIRNAEELRVKETDRLAAIAKNLNSMGAKVKETKDGLKIIGPTPLRGAKLDSFGDHRIAMSCAIAGLIAEGETIIQDSDSVDISFPHFFELLESIAT